MLCFYPCELLQEEQVRLVSEKPPLSLDALLWRKGREYEKRFGCMDSTVVRLYRIVDGCGKPVCYAYQDMEANRELRMLEELESSENALQFEDIFPEIKEVEIRGCNELAVCLAGYLRKRGIHVFVTGKYWKELGFPADENAGERHGRLIIHADGIEPRTGNVYVDMQKSVSVEFECIDKIYEANVSSGRIQDIEGGGRSLLDRLKDEREIVLWGTTIEAQDTYDLLLAHGSDICCFVTEEPKQSFLLGKPVMSISEAACSMEKPVFLYCNDKGSALGGKVEEYVSYLGYQRNRQFYYVKDYMDIPCTNLVHVLKHKKVLLVGDKYLGRMLADYLADVEKGDIEVSWSETVECRVEGRRGEIILCIVLPAVSILGSVIDKEAFRKLREKLGAVGFTEYFTGVTPLVIADEYRHRQRAKYTLPELTPRGIVLGKIDYTTGNAFFRGLLKGHPEVLSDDMVYFYGCLFYYCVRLSDYSGEDILTEFWNIYNKETGGWGRERFIANPDAFDRNVRQFLLIKPRFTSQELFVLFHIAYEKTVHPEQECMISSRMIYSEPHRISRLQFPSLARWLRSEEVPVKIVSLRRDQIVRAASRFRTPSGREKIYDVLFNRIYAGSEEDSGETEYKMRFEDIKLRPKQYLSDFCDWLGIAWSDTLLKSVRFNSVTDYDIKPVFNKNEECFSEFDRFRISIASGWYQKKYGYTYESCLKFSRRELQDMFLKKFKFQEGMMQGDDFQLSVSDIIRWDLWEVRKRELLYDGQPEFEPVNLNGIETSIRETKGESIS